MKALLVFLSLPNFALAPWLFFVLLDFAKSQNLGFFENYFENPRTTTFLLGSCAFFLLLALNGVVAALAVWRGPLDMARRSNAVRALFVYGVEYSLIGFSVLLYIAVWFFPMLVHWGSLSFLHILGRWSVWDYALVLLVFGVAGVGVWVWSTARKKAKVLAAERIIASLQRYAD